MANAKRKVTSDVPALDIRIRRCAGNKACWVALCGPNDYMMQTSYSLDTLVHLVTERHGACEIRLKVGK